MSVLSTWQTTDSIPTMRDRIEVPTDVTLWGQPYTITPRFCGTVFGDGKALWAISPINNRPNYYVVALDSSWVSDGEQDPYVEERDIRTYMDDVLAAIDEEYCSVNDEWYQEGHPEYEEPEWPVLDESLGVCWWRVEILP